MANKTINDLATELTPGDISDKSTVKFATYKTDEATPKDRKISLETILDGISVLYHYDTLADAFAGTYPDGAVVRVDRYGSSHTVGDGSGNLYVYDAGSAATIDGGFVLPGIGGVLGFTGAVFSGTPGTGRLIAVDQTEANILKFGATPAIADNWSPIQQAIKAVEALGTDISFQTVAVTGNAPPVVIPRGVFVVSQTLVSSGNSANSFSSLRIVGKGRDASFIQAHDTFTGAELIRFDPVDSPTIDANNGWEITDVCIEGPNPSFVEGAETLVGINAMKSAYFKVRRCKIRYWATGIRLRNWSNQITGNRIEYCDQGIFIDDADGIDGQQTINDIIIERNSVANVIYGIKTAKSLPINYLVIINNQFDGNSRAGILFNGPIEQFVLNDNYFERAGRTGQATISTNGIGGTALVDGAVVIHPTTDNTAAASGTILRNIFLNCNLTSTISLSGTRQIEIKGNKVAGSAVTNFVNIENASGIASGPLPYTTTQRVEVDGSTVDNNNVTLVTNLVNIDNTETSHARIEAVDRKLSIHEAPYLNDLDQWEDIGTEPILRSDANGETTWVYNGATGNLRKRIIVTFDAQSGWSNAIVRLHGQCRPTGGSGGFFIRVTIDGGFVKDMFFPAFSGGSWGVGRTEAFKLPASGTMQLELFRDGALPTATSLELRNFCVCTAAYPVETTPTLKPIRRTSFDTYADLFLSSTVDDERVTVDRYSTNHVVGDRSGQVLRYDEGSSATIDGGFVFPGLGGALSFDAAGAFNGTAGTGRFIAVDQTAAELVRFGARPSSATDSNTALIRAIDAAIANKIPLNVNAEITVDTWTEYTVSGTEELTICGTTNDARLIFDDLTAVNFVRMEGKNLTVENLALQGWKYPIFMAGTSIDTVRVKGCQFNTCEMMVTDAGEGTAACKRFIVEDCRGQTLQDAGIRYRATTIGQVSIRNNVIDGLSGTAGTHGIQVGANQDGMTSEGVVVAGNKVLNVTDSASPVYGILLYGPNVVCRDNYVDTVYSTGTSTTSYGIYAKAEGVVIDGNHLYDCGLGGSTENRGINIKGANRGDVGPTTPFGHGARVTNNRVYYATAPSSVDACIECWRDESVISGNHCEGSEHGIVILGNYCTASDNVIVDCTGRAIYIYDASDVAVSNTHIRQVADTTWPYFISSSANAVERIKIDGGSVEDNGTTTRPVVRLECITSIDDVTIDNIDGTGFGYFAQPGGAGAANVGRVVLLGGCRHDGTYYSGVNAGMIVDGVRCTGSPESVIVSAIGGRVMRTDGGAGTTQYNKESGTASTGWIGK